MRVRFFGVRGSIPTPGPSTVRYGGNTVCVEVQLADDTRILLDAGTGMRDAGKAILAEGYRGKIHVAITHPHWDHIMGLPFFAPVFDSRAVVVFHPMSDAARSRARDPIVFDGVHFPVPFSALPSTFEHAEHDDEVHHVGSATIRKAQLHHPGGAIGYRIEDSDGTALCYLTDNELQPDMPDLRDELARFAHGAALLIHDAQYLPADMPAKRGWGHSVVDDVLALGKQAEVRTLALFHHDPDRDDDALDAIAATGAAWAKANAPDMTALVAREGLALDLAR
jgi:phosphoribosyl 1,2-cyclic phosphodiesterase